MQKSSKNRNRYSSSLLERFKSLYYSKFNKKITEQKAMQELDFLASIVKILFLEKLVKSIKAGGIKK